MVFGIRWIESIRPDAICWAFWLDCLDRIPDWISIWSEHHDTSPRFRTLMYVHSYALRYVHHESMCSVLMGHDNDVDSFHDQDGRWSRFDLRFDNLSIKPNWPYWHTETWCSSPLRLIQIITIGGMVKCGVLRLITIKCDLIRWYRIVTSY